MNCLRPECDNELNKGAKYCSPKCAAVDRKRIKAEKESESRLGAVPMSMQVKLKDQFGDDAQVVIDEVSTMLAETTGSVPLPIAGTTYGDWTLSIGDTELRPGTELSYDVIDRMLRSGPVMFAMEMKRAQIVRVFAEGRYRAVSPDLELGEVATAALKLIMEKMADDLTYSTFAYGSAFMEEVWEWKTKYELGLTEKPDNAKFLVPKLPNNVKPDTVEKINRTENGRKFDGFTQKANQYGDDAVVVGAQQALVVPINEHFRNLFGRSFLHTLYPIWLWYEIILRAMARYMERMAVPVAVGKAPSRGLVEVEGKTTPVKAMDMALALAGSAAKSNAIAIPSDKDENGNPLWELDYLTAAQRAQPFIAVLEYLGQEMLRAALSADRSLTQQSGGVGSQNIGEVHARASAMTSEMILGQILHYLNLYFMPGFSLYNRGKNGPPIWLKTQPIDLTERELVMKMLNTAGNSPASQEFMAAIDWRGMAETSNIPLLSPEETEELKKRLNEESLAKLKQQNELMATLKKAEAGNMDGNDGNDGKDPNKAPDKKQGKKQDDFGKKNDSNKQLQQIIDGIVDGNLRISLTLGPDEAETLHELGAMDDETFQLFNPFHDRMGRFSSGKGGGGRGGAKTTRKATIDKARSKPGSIIKTTGKVLGLGGLGLVGLMVVGAALSGSGEAEMSGMGDEESRKEEAEKVQQKIDELTQDWPKFASGDDGVNFAINKLRSEGFDIPTDIQVDTSGAGLRAGWGGMYLYDENKLVLRASIVDGIAEGDPASIHILMHELAHANQEFAGEHSDLGNDSEMISDPDWRNKFTPLYEGQNDLVTAIQMSDIYNKPMDQSDIIDLSNRYADLKREKRAKESGVYIQGDAGSLSEVGYQDEAETWAAIATIGAEKTGTTPTQYLKDAHSYGFSQNESHQVLVNIFPEEMRNNGYYNERKETVGGVLGIGGKEVIHVERKFPTQRELRQWMSNHGYVDPKLAYNQMLEEASR